MATKIYILLCDSLEITTYCTYLTFTNQMTKKIIIEAMSKTPATTDSTTGKTIFPWAVVKTLSAT